MILSNQKFINQENLWNLLPNEVSGAIATYLNPSDLAALSQTSTKFTEEIVNDGWKSIADRIQCSLNPQLPPKQQVQVFIHELKQKAEVLQNLPYAAPLIKSNVVDEIYATCRN